MLGIPPGWVPLAAGQSADASENGAVGEGPPPTTPQDLDRETPVRRTRSGRLAPTPLIPAVRRSAALLLAAAAAALAPAAGCSKAEPVTTGFATPLPPGAPSLRRADPGMLRVQLSEALLARDARLIEACDASIRWFSKPSSRTSYPFTTGTFSLTHDRARRSVEALRRMLMDAGPPQSAAEADALADRILARFEGWESVGWDGSGEVLFTGYYAPTFRASRTPSPEFPAPIHVRPDDLVTDPATGAPQGRRTSDGRVVPYYTRGEIERGNLLAGQELAWIENEFDAYLIHVNGSARLLMPDGTDMYVGYAGKTDRPYASLGKAMIREGLMDPDRASIPAMRDAWRRNPAAVNALMPENESFVFFTEYGGGEWPTGSLGVKVHPLASIATDKSVFPRGGAVLVDTRRRTYGTGDVPFTRLMLDQDTGGAITAPGRADLFMGTGAAAGILAGGQHATGTMTYLVLREDTLVGAR